MTAAGTSGHELGYGVNDDESFMAALQRGSYILAAPWLNIEKPIGTQGCFGVLTLEGNISGVPDDVSLVVSEMEEDDSRHSGRSGVRPSRPRTNLMAKSNHLVSSQREIVCWQTTRQC